MGWIWLLLAGILEIGWAVGFKYTEGFTKVVPTALTMLALVLSLGLLALSLKDIPVGTAYAVWAGIGTVGTAVLSIYLFNEPATAMRLACIGMITAGIVGLKVVG